MGQGRIWGKYAELSLFPKHGGPLLSSYLLLLSFITNWSPIATFEYAIALETQKCPSFISVTITNMASPTQL
jgi:hypothetical protein